MILRRPFRKLGQLKIDATRPEVALRYRRMPDALRFSLAFGTHGVYYCASLTAVLLANGAVDLRAMALATAAMSFESLARGDARRATCRSCPPWNGLVSDRASDRTRVKQRVCASATSRPTASPSNRSFALPTHRRGIEQLPPNTRHSSLETPRYPCLKRV